MPTADLARREAMQPLLGQRQHAQAGHPDRRVVSVASADWQHAGRQPGPELDAGPVHPDLGDECERAVRGCAGDAPDSLSAAQSLRTAALLPRALLAPPRRTRASARVWAVGR